MEPAIRVADIQVRLGEVKDRIRALQIEARLLEELISRATMIAEMTEMPEFQPSDESKSIVRPSARAAILDFVAKQPGLTPTEIANRLQHLVDSRATDVRNVLRTTVAKLVHEGLVRREEGNRCYPA